MVVDTSVLFSIERMPQDADIYAPPGVFSELERHGDTRHLLLQELITVIDPGRTSLSLVRKAATETGDDARLSTVDLEVVALAHELRATILTDDYSIQNLASHMGLDFQGVGQSGISKVLRWKYKCLGCGRVWKERFEECPVCGSPLRSHRSRK